MKIREAKKSDHGELIGLYDIFLNRKNKDSFFRILKDPKSFIFVAEEKNRLIGFLTFFVRYVVRYSTPIGQIEELFVLKGFRKQGAGKKLIRAAEQAAKKFGCRRTYVESAYEHSPAHKFYQNLGYKKSGYYFLKK